MAKGTSTIDVASGQTYANATYKLLTSILGGNKFGLVSFEESTVNVNYGNIIVVFPGFREEMNIVTGGAMKRVGNTISCNWIKTDNFLGLSAGGDRLLSIYIYDGKNANCRFIFNKYNGQTTTGYDYLIKKNGSQSNGNTEDYDRPSIGALHVNAFKSYGSSIVCVPYIHACRDASKHYFDSEGDEFPLKCKGLYAFGFGGSYTSSNWTVNKHYEVAGRHGVIIKSGTTTTYQNIMYFYE